MTRVRKLSCIFLSALSAACLLCSLVSCSSVFSPPARKVVRKLDEAHGTDILSYADVKYYAYEWAWDGAAYWAALELKVEPTVFLNSFAESIADEKNGTDRGWYYSENTDGADSADWTWTGDETMAAKATGPCYWRAGRGRMGVARLSLYIETKTIFFYEDTY